MRSACGARARSTTSPERRRGTWRTRVEDEWLTANTTLLDALLMLERFDDVLHHLGDLQTDRPDDVTLMMQRLSALQGLGRYSEEVVYYLTSRRRLRHRR